MVTVGYKSVDKVVASSYLDVRLGYDDGDDEQATQPHLQPVQAVRAGAVQEQVHLPKKRGLLVAE